MQSERNYYIPKPIQNLANALSNTVGPLLVAVSDMASLGFTLKTWFFPEMAIYSLGGIGFCALIILDAGGRVTLSHFYKNQSGIPYSARPMRVKVSETAFAALGGFSSIQVPGLLFNFLALGTAKGSLFTLTPPWFPIALTATASTIGTVNALLAMDNNGLIRDLHHNVKKLTHNIGSCLGKFCLWSKPNIASPKHVAKGAITPPLTL